MLKLWFGTAVSAFGGSIFLYFLKNFLLREKKTFTWDWDGIIERGIIAYSIIANQWLYLIPVVIIIKTIYHIALIGFFENLTKITEPGTIPQKVRLKAELAFDLILSPILAILIGITFCQT